MSSAFLSNPFENFYSLLKLYFVCRGLKNCHLMSFTDVQENTNPDYPDGCRKYAGR